MHIFCLFLGAAFFIAGIVLTPQSKNADGKREAAPQANDLRIVEEDGGYVLETYQDWPGWRPLSGRLDTLESTRSRKEFLEKISKPKVVDGSLNTSH